MNFTTYIMGKCFSCCKRNNSVMKKNLNKCTTASNSIKFVPGDCSEEVASGDLSGKSCELNAGPTTSLPPIHHPKKFVEALVEHQISEAKIIRFFSRYTNAESDKIVAEGVENLCEDLNLPPDHFKILLLAWKFDARQMYEFSKSEFITGCTRLRVSSPKSLRRKLDDVYDEVKSDEVQFRKLYEYAFRFALDEESGQRILPLDIAICLWPIVFYCRDLPILNAWLDYLKMQGNAIRGIPRDTWNMFLNFVEIVGDDLSSYDDKEAWPSLLDDFVEYENDRRNCNLVNSSAEKCE